MNYLNPTREDRLFLLHSHAIDGDQKLRMRWQLDGTLDIVAKSHGHELIKKYGKYMDYSDRTGLRTLGAFGSDREAVARWKGWLRAGGVDQ